MVGAKKGLWLMSWEKKEPFLWEVSGSDCTRWWSIDVEERSQARLIADWPNLSTGVGLTAACNMYSPSQVLCQEQYPNLQSHHGSYFLICGSISIPQLYQTLNDLWGGSGWWSSFLHVRETEEENFPFWWLRGERSRAEPLVLISPLQILCSFWA